MATRLVIRQTDELKDLFAQLRDPALGKAISRVMVDAAFRIQINATQKQIKRGGRFRVGGKLRSSPPHPTMVTSRTGELRRSIASERGVDKSKLPREISVGSDLVYAGVHEYGLYVRGVKYPKRAFLAPAAEVVAPLIPDLMVAELERVTGGRV